MNARQGGSFMAQTLAMRATSLAASTALLALAGIAAFSVSWTVAHLPPQQEGPVITSERLVLETPKAPSPPVRRPPPTDTSRPTETTEPAQPTHTSFNTEGSLEGVPDPGPPTITDAHW